MAHQIIITETHPDNNYDKPISELFKDYGLNPNYEKIINLND